MCVVFYMVFHNEADFMETNCLLASIKRFILYTVAREKVQSVCAMYLDAKKVREKSRECHNHKPQPFPDPKRKRKPTNLNKHKPNKRTKSTKISSLFPKRGNRNTKRTEKHKNKMTHIKTYNKSPRRIKKVREKSRECHNHKPQPFPEPKRKPTNLNKHKPNKRTKSTKISSLFPKRGNRNTKRTEKHKNKMTHGKTYNKSPRRINYKATRSKTNTGTTALGRSVEQTTGGV